MKRAGVPVIAAAWLFFAAGGLSLSAQEVQGADRGGEDRSGFRLEQNYPNPFNPETRIPFVLDEGAFPEGAPATVSMRIYTILMQHVATPTALGHSNGEGSPLTALEYLVPGRYEAYWDGRDHGGNTVASGVYIMQLVVNGRQATQKMFVTK